MDIVCGLKIADTVLSITKTIIADFAPRLQNYIKGFVFICLFCGVYCYFF